MMSRAACLLVVFFAYSACGCSVSENPTGASVARAKVSGSAESPLLPNLQQLTENIYCGGEPRHQDAFGELAGLGIKTVVSVDGARPDIENAHRHGLRYVHIPIGYDGIKEQSGLSLARLVREADGPFYIHCHHGRHRGPAAAAVACLATGEVDRRQALEILKRAGTSRKYAGLWRAVESYHVPGSNAVLPELVAVASVDSFSAAMADVDRAFDRLKLCHDANWMTLPEHPDLEPGQLALLVREGLRESRRNLPDTIDQQFATWLADAEDLAHDVEKALSENNTRLAARDFRVLAQSCTRCHARYRK